MAIDLLLYELMFDTLNLKAFCSPSKSILKTRHFQSACDSTNVSQTDGRTLSGQTRAFLTSISHCQSSVQKSASITPEHQRDCVRSNSFSQQVRFSATSTLVCPMFFGG